jgi:hypothetical protein
MTTHSPLLPARLGRAFGRFLRPIFVLTSIVALSSAVFAQQAGAEDAQANGRGNRGNRGNRGQNGGPGGNFDPSQIQARMMENLRTQFGVTNDDEWKVIEERITAVTEVQRSAMAAAMGMRGGRGGRGGRGNNPELDALRTAVTDNAPDAEVKARLERLREVRKTNQAKLEKAQEDLRAVLTIRQEAVAVMAGLLP